MMRILSPKECKELDRKVKKWWIDLNEKTRLEIYNFFQPLLAQMYCEHDWQESIGTAKFIACRKCGLLQKEQL